jgi:hypothetical protein
MLCTGGGLGGVWGTLPLPPDTEHERHVHMFYYCPEVALRSPFGFAWVLSPSWSNLFSVLLLAGDWSLLGMGWDDSAFFICMEIAYYMRAVLHP